MMMMMVTIMMIMKAKPEYPAHLPCRPALESQTSPCAASPAGKTTSIVVSHLVLGLG